MHDFNIEDDLTLSIDPVVLPADNYYASGSGLNSSLGVRLALTF